MKQKAIINLWDTVILEEKSAGIEIFESTTFIYDCNDKYLIQLETIEEVSIYKLDHMSFDTLVLRITTGNHEFQIPYHIVFNDYVNEGDENLIPKFKLKPIINGFEELVNWLNKNLTNFELDWLDDSKPIIDNANIVINYRIQGV